MKSTNQCPYRASCNNQYTHKSNNTIHNKTNTYCPYYNENKCPLYQEWTDCNRVREESLQSLSAPNNTIGEM